MRKRKSSTLPFEQRGGASVEETAEYLGVGRNTVYEYINAGKIKVAKLGSRTCVITASVLKFLRAEAASGKLANPPCAKKAVSSPQAEAA